MINVVVVDDHPLVREGFKWMIGEDPEMTVTGEAGDGSEAVDVISRGPCDVVILDLAIPKRNGLEILKQLMSEKPRLAVLVVSAYSEDVHALRCLRAGAAGFLKKETAVPDLLNAIRTVAQGRKYLTASVAEKLISNIDQRLEAQHEALSPREQQVFSRLACGKSSGDIAEELGLSIKTVSTYRTRVLEKLHLANTAQLVHYAITQGLVLEP
jgi:two-component system invasion response regulator UvrY